MPYRNSEKNINLWHQAMVNLVNSRKHVLISGRMTQDQRQQCYHVYCPLHDLSKCTSYFNYKRSCTGCLLPLRGAVEILFQEDLQDVSSQKKL